jgi:hypothetical protein
MISELPSITLDEVLRSSSPYDDGYTAQIRGLNQAIKNASVTASCSTTGTLAGATGSQLGISPGYTYTTNTTGPYSIGPGTLNQGNVIIANTQFEQSGKMVMKGKEADIEINGKSMSAWMEKVEQRLTILHPNPDMEKDWDDLRRLGERYRKLEKKCQEKAQMWEALKKLPKTKL